MLGAIAVPAVDAGDLDAVSFAAHLVRPGPTIAPDVPARVAYEPAITTDAPRVPAVDRDGAPGLAGTAIAGRRELENITIRAGASWSSETLWAPSGPAGKRTTSPRAAVSSPSGVRTVTSPSSTSSHSSAYS
jgi:hypothetical protein